MARASEPARRASLSRDASDRGALLHLEGDLEGAKAAYEEALEADPDNPAALNNLGFLLAQTGKVDEAAALYRRAIEVDPGSSMAKVNLGNLFASAGDLGGAVAYLREAVVNDPGNALAWDSLGRVLLLAGKARDAEEAYRRAIDAAPNWPARDLCLLYAGLGTAAGALGRRDEAVQVLRRAVAVDSTCVEAWTQLGVALFLRRDFGSAGEALRRALALDPDAVRARRYLGMTHLAIGERSAARKELERAHRIDPGDVKVRADLAALDLSEGRAADALARVEGCEAPGEDGDRLRFYRGLALDRLGREEEALAVMRPLAEQGASKYAAEARKYLEARETARGGREKARA